jgi:3-oxoacyl-(acyl-carrier-protein) synthase
MSIPELLLVSPAVREQILMMEQSATIEKQARSEGYLTMTEWGAKMVQDGKTNGLTAPNGPSQTAVVRAALESAGLAGLGDLDYFELHGTGTPLGDPIEIRGLLAVGNGTPERDGICRVGTVKPQIGHLGAVPGGAD